MRRTNSLVIVVSLVAAALTVASSASAAPSQGGSAGHSRRLHPEQVALAKARATGKPVQVAGEQSATATVLAEPDGTFRAIITAVPTRVRRGTSWIKASTVLRRGSGGVIRPVATSRPLVLSGGGTVGPLVSLGSGTQRLDLRWSGRLPAPVLSGSTATYRNVLPGVDLRVTARYAGYTQLFVVHSRAAGQRLLASHPSLRVTSPGLAVRSDGHGGLAAVTRTGKVVFTAPAPVMWDSGPANPQDGSRRTVPVGMSLRGDQLYLRPDSSMLTSKATRFPVMIDPSFSGATLNWVDPLELHSSELTWNGENIGTDPNGVIEMGKDPTFATRARAMFQMNTQPVYGKHLLGATFRITEGWANNCTATEVDLWETGSISSSTDWTNQPSWMKEISSLSTAHRTTSTGSCGEASIAFNALTGVQDAATNNWPNLTLGLRAADESTIAGWKRFFPDASLQIDYNSIPTVGTMSTNPPLSPQCVSGGSAPASNDPYLNSATPTLTAAFSDADTAQTQEDGNFVWQSWNGSAWVAAGSGTDPIGRAANTQTSLTLPAGSLTDGTTYRWQVRIADPLQSPYTGTDFSAWSPWCEFIADFVPPPAPQVSGTVYTSACSPSCGGVGVTGTFTLTGNVGGAAPDVTKYLYGFSDPPNIALTPSSQGGSASFSFTPTHGGPYTLFVSSQDAGGNISAETRYTFTVGAPAPAVGNWRLNGDLSDDMASHPLTLVGAGNLSAPGLKVQNSALGLAGGGQYAKTSGPVLNTTQSFTVSAWVKLTNTASYHVAVSQAGQADSGFFLEYSPTLNRWVFTGDTSDTNSPPTNYAVTSLAAPTTGVWTQLTATYDAATMTASLYVNGVFQASAVASVAPWNATGSLLIGSDWFDGSAGANWIGSISNVEVWQRELMPSEISALADTTSDPVGSWSFSEVGDAAGSATEDASFYNNELMLMGSAQIPASGAGHDGTGLLLLNSNGWAQSDGLIDGNGSVQVLHTDQSFTVSAWVRLGGTSLPATNEYAISQAGTTASAFSLGYIASPNPHWGFVMAQADTASPAFDTAASSTPLTTADLGVWHLLTGSFNAATKTMTLAVDGTVVGTTTRGVASWDSAGPFIVGGGWYNTADTNLWNGAIDEVRAYQGTFTSALDDWQFATCTGSPVTCTDQGTGNHPLTLGTGVTWTPGSYTGSGLTFTGAGTASTAGGTPVDTSGPFTASAWVNLAAVPSADGVVVAEAGTHQDFFELSYKASLGQWCATVFSGDSGTASASSACAGSVQPGTWTQLAGVFDPLDQTVSLYLNGTLAGTASDTATWKASGGVSIGGGWRNGAVAGLLTGRVDDVRLYNGIVADLSALQ
ncbi:MAG TPA: LamG domain-containing protein [Streptosporangiaceae bacterium]|nr:LamG domain-containing protein [Streptosporangiaceae bacterium]